MSDFLSSLTARSFKPMDDIRPRLPARFETTVASTEAPLIESLEQDEWVTQSPQTPATSPMPQPTTRQPAEPPQNEVTPRTQMQPTQPEAVQPRVQQPEPLRVEPTVHPASVASMQERPFEKIAPALIPNPSPSGRREKDAVQPAFEVPRPEGEGYRVRASESSPPPIQPKIPAPEAGRPDVPTEQHQRPAPLPVSPRLVAPAETRADTANVPIAKPAAPETVVRVSIGRVEVRVKTPPAKAAPARQPAPPLRPAVSLNDYLKRRQGGKS